MVCRHEKQRLASHRNAAQAVKKPTKAVKVKARSNIVRSVIKTQTKASARLSMKVCSIARKSVSKSLRRRIPRSSAVREATKTPLRAAKTKSQGSLSKTPIKGKSLLSTKAKARSMIKTPVRAKPSSSPARSTLQTPVKSRPPTSQGFRTSAKAKHMSSAMKAVPSTTPVRGKSAKDQQPKVEATFVQGSSKTHGKGAAKAKALATLAKERLAKIQSKAKRSRSVSRHLREPAAARHVWLKQSSPGEDARPVQCAKQKDSSQSESSPAAFACVALRSFLRNPIGMTNSPAAFQLRCKQCCQATHRVKKAVVIVDGQCKLWKLNQILAECFGAGEGEFAYQATKGTTVLGSQFVVSRPLNPGQCDKVIICDGRSAAHVGSQAAFVDDRSFSLAQLFRGKSTRDALKVEPAEAAQKVTFASPSLGADVRISLDGIMLDSFDSQKLFDKKRRHNNGSMPLPRMVRSSFLSIAEIEAKNILMQGSREGPDFLLQIATPWSAFHASSRRAQRKPLFRRDGRDYDLNDLCYVSGDEETDSDVDSEVDEETDRRPTLDAN